MKQLFYITIIVFTFAIFTTAQTRTKVFDNFDTKNGVQVVVTDNLPPAAPIKAKNSGEKLVKKTGQTKMSVQDGLGLNGDKFARSGKLAMSAGTSMNGFTTGDATIDSYIVESSRRYRIDPLLIYAQMHQESGFRIKATSYKGASGLMQLMPATARRFGVTKIYDPQQNIDAGVKYMRWLLDTFNGDVVLALAGYNAGEGAVMKYGWNVPPYRETQEYVRRITARYNVISNPTLARSVKPVSKEQAAKIENKTPAPLTVFEPDATAVKTPDGRMRLVNQ
jgi:soluble lytic murein transglycosylase-like protein